MGFKMSQVLSAGKYLKAADCDPAILVTISKVTQEDIGQDHEKKFVVWFEENDRGLVLNATNGASISEVVGDDDSDAWTGHKVVLFKTQTDYAGRRVDCIRVRAPRSKAAQSSKQVDVNAAMHNTVAAADLVDLQESDIPF